MDHTQAKTTYEHHTGGMKEMTSCDWGITIK